MPEMGMPWVAWMEIEAAVGMQAVLPLIMQIDPDHLKKALGKISHQEAVGPIFNPNAFLQPNAFENMSNQTIIIRKVLELRLALQDVVDQELSRGTRRTTKGLEDNGS